MSTTHTASGDERVLIADDEVLIRTNLQEMLEAAGYQVVCSCGDGFAAIEGCQKHHPDIALLDIKMPMLDGMAAARFILEHDLAPVVILMTEFRSAVGGEGQEFRHRRISGKACQRDDLDPDVEGCSRPQRGIEGTAAAGVQIPAGIRGSKADREGKGYPDTAGWYD